MILKDTLSFLRELRDNNRRDWFEANRPRYERARQNFLDVVRQLIAGVSEFDAEVAASGLEAKRCVMRIHRDVRFSKDKTPYKTNFFAFINRGGRKSPYAGYYLNVGAGESFHGGGIYLPPAEVLAAVRQEIDYNLAEWKDIIGQADLRHHYDAIRPSGQLKRPPKGYAADNPAVGYLKYKGYYTQHNLTADDLTRPDLVLDTLAAFRTLNPFVDFLNRNLEPA